MAGTNLFFRSNDKLETFVVNGMDVVIGCDGSSSSETGFLKLVAPGVKRKSVPYKVSEGWTGC